MDGVIFPVQQPAGTGGSDTPIVINLNRFSGAPDTVAGCDMADQLDALGTSDGTVTFPNDNQPFSIWSPDVTEFIAGGIGATDGEYILCFLQAGGSVCFYCDSTGTGGTPPTVGQTDNLAIDIQNLVDEADLFTRFATVMSGYHNGVGATPLTDRIQVTCDQGGPVTPPQCSSFLAISSHTGAAMQPRASVTNLRNRGWTVNNAP